MTTLESKAEALFGETIFGIKHVLLAHVEVVSYELCAGKVLFQIGLVNGADQRLAKVELVHLRVDIEYR